MQQINELETEQGNGGSLFAHLPAIIWQRRWYLIIPVIVMAIAGIAAALLLPVRYTSTATLLVQSSTLPQAVAAGNPDDVIDRRIARIREQVLSRPELIDLVNRYQLYPKKRADTALSDIVAAMRNAVTIAPLSAELQQGNNSNTIAFVISYSYTDPSKAQAVAQDLSEQVLQLDATQSTQQASSSVQFLADQARSLQQQISEQEDQIAAIKSANGMILSSAGITMLGGGGGSYDVQIAALQRENSQLLTQRNLASTADTRDPMVAQAEAQLAAARAVYSDDHPDVRLARQRLTEAKSLARNVANAPVSAIDEQVAFNNRQIAALRSAQGSENARANATIGAQSRAPLVLQQIAQLQQKLDGLNEQYKGVSDRLFQARAGVKAENEQLGERLSIVNPPVVPNEPSSPKRWMLLAGGPLAGFALGMVLLFLVELILRPIRDPAALTQLFGETPLGVIPTVATTTRSLKRNRFGRIKRQDRIDT